jgi:hypothetical protein
VTGLSGLPFWRQRRLSGGGYEYFWQEEMQEDVPLPFILSIKGTMEKPGMLA